MHDSIHYANTCTCHDDLNWYWFRLSQTSAALPQLEPGQSLVLALGIHPVPNLRDVGGFKTREGSAIVRGLAYRSDTFNPMSAEDIKKLELLNLKNDYDLRTTSEVKVKPDQMPPGVQYELLNVLADAKSAAPAELEALMHEPKKANAVLGGGKIEALFKEAYREFISLPSAMAIISHAVPGTGQPREPTCSLPLHNRQGSHWMGSCRAADAAGCTSGEGHGGLFAYKRLHCPSVSTRN